MDHNVGMADRILRIILAVGFIMLALVKSPVQSLWWFLPAALALVTGTIGWCAVYTAFGWNTATVQAQAKTSKKAARKKARK